MQTVNTRQAIGIFFVVASLSQGCGTKNGVNDVPLLAAAASAPSTSYVISAGSDIVKSSKDSCVRTSGLGFCGPCG